jgi:UMP-CMP kinase
MGSGTGKQKPQVTFVLGGPGSGKGTICEMLVKQFPDIVHLSAGDLLRAEQATKSKNSKLISDYIKEGKVVPVVITCNLIKNAMKNHGWAKKRYLVDGFPRNNENLEGWNKIIGNSADLKQVMYIECTKEEMMDRLLKRAKIQNRPDDNKETIEKRFKNFDSTEFEMVKHFRTLNIVKNVNGSLPIDEAYKEAMKLF